MRLDVSELESCPSATNGYSVAVLSSVAEIRGLLRLVCRSRWRNDILTNPEFFLASVSVGWEPRVVVVRYGGEVVGMVCAKERVLPGPHLGVVYVDLTFGSTLLGHPLEQEHTLLIGLRTWLASSETRGIRLRVRRGSPELAAVRSLLPSSDFDVHVARFRDHAILSLPGTYEQLLRTFGSTTRRNFRYYRRRFESAGHVYVDNLSLEELRSAAFFLEPKCTRRSRSNSIDRLLKMAAASDRPLAAGLKHRNGEWLSISAGVYRRSSGVLLLQLNNDRDYSRDSLSVVLRAYLMESLIHQGMKEFIFWGGTAPPLSRYVTLLPTLGIYLDSPEYSWRLVRGLVSKVGPWLPKELKKDARWIAPFS